VIRRKSVPLGRAVFVANGAPERAQRRSTQARPAILLIGNYPHDRQESMQRFAALLLRELHANQFSAELISPEPVFGRLKKSGSGLGKWLGYLDKFLIFPIRLRRAVYRCHNPKTKNQNGRVLVHICDHSNAFYTHSLSRVPHLVTCHDLLAVRSARGEFPENPTGWSGRRLQTMIVRGLNDAQCVVCDSAATQTDLLRLTRLQAGQAPVIPVALNYPYSQMPDEEAAARVRALRQRSAGRRREGLPNFLLHVGGNQWYKNRLGVLRIYAALAAQMENPPELIMAGKAPTPVLAEFVAAHGLQDRVQFIEDCTNEDLRALYSTAALLLFPSVAEGFGWPLIEAQACGCPVLCSEAGPFKEVVGESGRRLPVEDEAGFVSAIQAMIAPNERTLWVEKGLANAARFTPARMIEGYLSVYDGLLAESPAGA
jgi:glycosyltransferase involved in cell wall biosynthesis